MLKTTIGGRYHIIKELGRGSYGQTWLAEDQHLPGSPYCVVKQFKPQPSSASTLKIAQRLFEEEPKILQQLAKHDLIPQIMAYVEENDERYLVQEYIQGHDLSTELNSGEKFSEASVIELLQQILQALEFIQQHNVIHRDIKPSNLMRREQDGKVVLIDFGAVKKWQPSNQHTAPTVVIGTLGYKPPEQDRGYPNLSSDIYAVGMIGIQALTGQLPNTLQLDSDNKVIWRNKQVKVSDELAAVLDKMVRYDFYERYSSATQALEALKEVKHKPQATILSTLSQPNIQASPSPHFNFKAMFLACSFFALLALGSFLLVSEVSKGDKPETIIPDTTPSPVREPCYPWC
ncbi:MAG: serine/threonine protein kinase [Symploca sp. SIO2C1]|nr:serine/threonine protein kinase [Symploca sp. SIO2C1]